MNRLVLGNISYRQHVTDEGEQLQAGLVNAGWQIAGHGYGDGCNDVATLLKRHEPDIVFTHDQVDWHKDFPGCFDPAVSFDGIECLADRDDICKVVVAKDSGTIRDADQALAKKIGANAAVLYYHPQSVLKLGPWLGEYELIRTYHSIDETKCWPLACNKDRDRAIVTGAIGDCYPIRRMVYDHCDALGIHRIPHPGYGNIGTKSNQYLQCLSTFKVHVATASEFGFCLRKIIESVAVGCTPVTNLPAYDVLPEIDQALVRIGEDPTLAEIKDAIDRAESEWNAERAMHFAEKCWRRYDWRVQGRWLSERITELSLAHA